LEARIDEFEKELAEVKKPKSMHRGRTGFLL
jgi:hypothetical protein